MSYYSPNDQSYIPPGTSGSGPRQIPQAPSPSPYVTPTPGNSGPRQIPGGTVAPPAQPGGQDIYAMLAELRNQANTPEGVAAYHRAVYGTNLDNTEKDQLAAMRTYEDLTPSSPAAPTPSYTNTNQVSYTPTNYGSGGNSGGNAPSGGSGLNRPGGLPGTNPANNYSDPNWIMSQIANRGLNQSDNPLYQQIQRYNTSLLNPTRASPSGGTNPVLDDLYQRLGGVSFDQPINLLSGFLGLDANGNYTGDGGAGGRGNRTITYWNGSGNSGGSGGGGGGVGGVPDTVGGSNSYFAQQMRNFFDPSRLDPANDPTMQPYLDALSQQVLETNRDLMGKMSARAEGTGRYGGGYYGKMVRDVGDAAATDISNASAAALMNSRQSALAQQLEGLGLINQRDLGAMQDATNRYGIDSSANASAAGSAAQAALARRGQDLDAITALMGYQQGGLGSLQRLGEFNGTQQGNASSALGSLFNQEQQGWNQAANAANWMGQNYWQGTEFDRQQQMDQWNRQQDEWSRRQAEAADAYQREQDTWSRGWADQFNENRLMNDWLSGLATIAGLGGTASGSATTPGAGINTTASTLAGALGGGMYGYGLSRS